MFVKDGVLKRLYLIRDRFEGAEKEIGDAWIGPLPANLKKRLSKELRKDFLVLKNKRLLGIWKYFLPKSKQEQILSDNEVKGLFEPLYKLYSSNFQAISDYIRYLEDDSVKRLCRIESEIADLEKELSSVSCSYIDFPAKESIKHAYKNLYDRISGYKDVPSTTEFKIRHNSIDEVIRKLNDKFVLLEMQKNRDLLNDINGKSLDEQQRRVVVTDEINNLVIAGAGSGKTLTVAAKVKYLVESKGIHPKDILLISFTRKASQEMGERINKEMGIGVEVNTFHKLGRGIISQQRGKAPGTCDKTDEIIKDYFRKEIICKPDSVNTLVSFLGYYLKMPEDIANYADLGSYIEATQGIDKETMRSKYIEARENQLIQNDIQDGRTIKQEKLKSIEEVMIANFLFMSGVEYEYERDYEIDTSDANHRQYKPDFFLPEYNIYIEHYGLNGDMRAPWLNPIKEAEYIEGYHWKKELHRIHSTTLIESFSYYNSCGTMLLKLKENLINAGVVIKEIDKADIYEQLYKNKNDRYFQELVKLVNTFISLLKSNRGGIKEIDKYKRDAKLIQKPFYRERTLLFLDIVSDVYNYYQSVLLDSKTIDFHDMINEAASIVESDSINFAYKYIIIDEFQDSSISRYNLIRAIQMNSGAKLLCVGDDWQSIYRFAGSDIGIFKDMGLSHDGVAVLRIEKTYRNPQALIDVVGKFVMKNNQQFKKLLSSVNKSYERPIEIVGYEYNPVQALVYSIDCIVRTVPEIEKIMILGRNHFDITFIEKEKEFKAYKSYQENTVHISYSKYPKILFEYVTTHSSKGLEADASIIINVNNHTVGFPNKISDDPLLQYVLTKKEEFRYAEERRLFYVALTRTKSLTYITTRDSSMSEFLSELIRESGVPYVRVEKTWTNDTSISCPECKTGRLLHKNKTIYCSNSPYCDFRTWKLEILNRPQKCSSCGYFLIGKRNGKTGHRFLGCMRHPNCTHTEQY